MKTTIEHGTLDVAISLKDLHAAMREWNLPSSEALRRIVIELHDQWIDQEQADPGSIGPVPPEVQALTEAMVQECHTEALDRPQRREDGQAEGWVATQPSASS